TATFFVTTGWVGTRGYATWSQLREMSDAGMSIQSHTLSHPFLSELTRADATRELSASKHEIEQRMGAACTTLALPGGDAPRGWRAGDYLELGFRCVATSRWGPNVSVQRDMLEVSRYTVRRETPTDLLRRQMLATEPSWSGEG